MTNNIPVFETVINGGFRIRNARKHFTCVGCKKKFTPGTLRFDYLTDFPRDTVTTANRYTFCLPCAHTTLHAALGTLQNAIEDPDSFKLISKL